MCSQPPRDIDDSYIVADVLNTIPLIQRDTRCLGLTGGEPTLLGDDFLRIVRATKNFLPETSLHVLSNGRLFQYLTFSRELGKISHPDIMIGIPLYSDIAHKHDFVVQSKGAFDETIRGILNLGRVGVPVEIRIVVHRHTYARLPQLAQFISRNLTFASQVALMGLEMMGYVKMNLEALWIDPVDYQNQLCEAVSILTDNRIRVSVYNHQLCVLDSSLWEYSVKSISDWKNEYISECEGCAAREQCGGFFASAKLRKSDHIRAIQPSQLVSYSR